MRASSAGPVSCGAPLTPSAASCGVMALGPVRALAPAPAAAIIGMAMMPGAPPPTVLSSGRATKKMIRAATTSMMPIPTASVATRTRSSSRLPARMPAATTTKSQPAWRKARVRQPPR